MQREFIVLKEEAGLRVDDFAYLHKISKKAMRNIKMQGKIYINDKEENVRYLVKEKDHIVFLFPKEKKGLQMEKETMDLKILYEDEEFLVIDKPKGMPCIPNHTYTKHTLAQGILGYYDKIGLDSTIHLVNRLDKETSGLLLVAKHRDMHHYFSLDIQQVERRYLARVRGHFDEKEGTIDAPIYRDERSIKRYIDPRGKNAITHYKVLDQQDATSLIECQLETGRTHQIRCHMAYIGHPLVNDPLYDDQALDDSMYLDSYYLRFKHPKTKTWVEIKKDLT